MATLSSPTLNKLLTNVRNLLNSPNPENSFWSDLELTEYINEGIRQYFVEVTMHNEGQFTTTANLNITQGQEEVDLPSDFFELRSLYKTVSNGYEILNYSNDVTSGYSTQGGTSSTAYYPYYFFRGNKLVIRPTPNFSETAGLRIEYIQFPDTMVNGGDALTSQVSPVFKDLIQMYAVYKAKLKESMVSGVDMASIPRDNMNALYQNFKDAISPRSKNPTYVTPFNPELT